MEFSKFLLGIFICTSNGLLLGGLFELEQAIMESNLVAVRKELNCHMPSTAEHRYYNELALKVVAWREVWQQSKNNYFNAPTIPVMDLDTPKIDKDKSQIAIPADDNYAIKLSNALEIAKIFSQSV